MSFIYEPVLVPDELILRALNEVADVMVACFVLAIVIDLRLVIDIGRVEIPANA